jgi:hypothetical protein
LDYPLGTRSGVEDARSIESTSKPPRKAKPIRTFHHWCRQCLYKLGKITLEGVKYSLEGSGATPAGSLARPHGNSTAKQSLHSSASAQMEARGLLSRVSVRGTLSDAHYEIARTQVETLNSTL